MAQFDPSTATPEDKPAPPAGFDPSTAQPFKEQGTISRIASDVGRSLKAGTEEIPGQLAGLADIAPALAFNARPITKLANAAGEATGFEPGKWAEQTSAAMSPEHQAAAKEIQDVWDSPDSSAGDIALAYARNPAYVLNIVARSAPSMLLGGLAGRAAMGVGRTVDAAGKVLPGLLERTAGQWAAPIAGGVGEGAVQAGQQMQQDEAQPNQRANAVAALGSGAIDAAIGAGSGRVANALGFETLQTALAGGKRTGKVLGPAARMALGAADEGLLQELPQSAQEQVWQNWAEGKPLWDGVPRQAIEGALAGLVMGAGANAHGGGQEAAPAASAAPAAAASPAAPGPIDFQDVGPITPTTSPGAAPTPGLGIPAVPGQLEPPNRDTGGLALAPLGPIARAARLAPPPEALPQPEPEGKKGAEGAAAAPPPPAHFPIDPSAGPISRAAAIAQGIQTPPAAAPAQAQAEPAAPRETEPFVPQPGDIVVDDHFEAAHAGATSPLNNRPEPTPAQKEAENYRVGRTRVAGMSVSIENPQGSTRSGTDQNGKPWSTLMKDHYGRLLGTIGADSTPQKRQHLDVFIKSGTPKDWSGPVFVVDTNKAGGTSFDEHKVIFGATDEADARAVFARNYDDGEARIRSVTGLSIPQFKAWAYDGTQKSQPLGQTAAPDAGAAPASTPVEPAAQPAGPAGAPAVPAASAPAAAVAKPSAPKGLRVGITPGDAEPITVHDGVVHVGRNPAINFETGEPVTVPEGAGAPQIAKALRDAGALPKRAKVFGMAQAGPETAAQELAAAAPKGEPDPMAQRWAAADPLAREKLLLAAGWKTGSLGMDSMKVQAWEKMTPGQRKRLTQAMEAAPVAAAARAGATETQKNAEQRHADARALGREAGARGDQRDPPQAFTSIEKQLWRAGWDDSKRVKVTPQVPTGPEPATQQVAAVHQEAGEPAEAATAPVVAESMSNAAAREDRTPAQMRTDLLKQVDEAIASAPDTEALDKHIFIGEAKKYSGHRQFEGTRTFTEDRYGPSAQLQAREGNGNQWHIRWADAKQGDKTLEVYSGSLAEATEHMRQLLRRTEQIAESGRTGRIGEPAFVTFDVPGDGKFKVLHDRERLAEFRRNVESSQGFKDKQPKTSVPRTNNAGAYFGVEGGSGTARTAVQNMVEEGDYQAALDYATVKGVSLDDLKLSKPDRKKLDDWLESKPQPSVEAPQAEEPPATAQPAEKGPTHEAIEPQQRRPEEIIELRKQIGMLRLLRACVGGK